MNHLTTANRLNPSGSALVVHSNEGSFYINTKTFKNVINTYSKFFVLVFYYIGIVV